MSFISYAQNLEDVILWRALKHVKEGLYIDVGAQDPLVDSVSLAFHKAGWAGIHVEPTIHYADRLRHERRGDIVVQAAVGNTPGLLRFFEISRTGISTADPAIAASHAQRGFSVLETTTVCVTLDHVLALAEGRPVHWLKIDVEGSERAVLESWLSSSVRPWIVIVESTLPLTQIQNWGDWEHLVLALGYRWIYFDGLNRFYVHESHPELEPAFESPPNVFDNYTLNGTASTTAHQLLQDRHRDELRHREEQSKLEIADLNGGWQIRLDAVQEELAAAADSHHDREAELADRHATLEAALGEANQIERGLAAELSAARSDVEATLRQMAGREREATEFLHSAQRERERLRTELLDRHAADIANLMDRHAQSVQSAEAARNATEERWKAALQATHLERKAERDAATQALADTRRLGEETLAAARHAATAALDDAHAREAASRNALLSAHERLFESSQANHVRLNAELLSRIDEASVRLADAERAAARMQELCSRLRAEFDATHHDSQSLRDRLADGAARINLLQRRLRAHDLRHIRQTARLQKAFELERRQVEDFARAQIGLIEAKAATERSALMDREHSLRTDLRSMGSRLDHVLAERNALSHRWTEDIRRIWNDHHFEVAALRRHSESLEANWSRALATLTAHQESEQRRIIDAAQVVEARLREELGEQSAAMRDLEARLASARQQLESIHKSFVWRLLARLTGQSVPAEPTRAASPPDHQPQPVVERADASPPLPGQTTVTTAHEAPPRITARKDHMGTHAIAPHDLFQLHDSQFVNTAYQALLGREADPDGYAHYLRRVRNGIPPQQIAAEILLSKEGLARDLPAYRAIVASHRKLSHPAFGWLYRWIRRASSAQRVERQVGSLHASLSTLRLETNSRFDRIEEALNGLHELISNLPPTLATGQSAVIGGGPETLTTVVRSKDWIAAPGPTLFGSRRIRTTLHELQRATGD